MSRRALLLTAGLPSAATVALCRQRLGVRPGAWLGWLGAGTVALAYAVVAAADGGRDMGVQLVGDALRGGCWLGAGPLALSLAADPAGRDRRDGVEQLALLRGVTAEGLALARLWAGMLGAAARVALPALVVCLVLSSTGGDWLLAASALGGVVIALLAGALLAALATICARLGAERGRLILLLVVLLPWLLSDRWGGSYLSVVDLLDAAVSVMVQVVERLGGVA